MLTILEDWSRRLRAAGSPVADRPGVLHSFAGTFEMAATVIDLGFYIGVTGPITYASAEKRRQLVRQLPLERLLIETDSPFLAPQQQRGRRNEPAFVAYIADKIAEVQSRTPSEVAHATSSNAARLFAWGKPD
jgi:TatD DNase family protein